MNLRLSGLGPTVLDRRTPDTGSPSLVLPSGWVSRLPGAGPAAPLRGRLPQLGKTKPGSATKEEMTAELATLAADPAALEAAADPAQFVVLACERAKEWLRQAVEHGDIEQIVEVKSQAEAIRVYTVQKQLGKDAELSAQEIVRRAERGLGLAIRKGQQNGTVARRGDIGRYPANTERDGVRGSHLARPSDFVSKDELRNAAYPLTDGVSGEQFDEAIAEARDEDNLSRNNVVRKVRAKREAKAVRDEAFSGPPVASDEGGWTPAADDRTPLAAVRRRELIRELSHRGFTSEQIGGRIGTSAESVRRMAREAGLTVHADEAMNIRTRRTVDSNRVVRETVAEIEGLIPGLDLVRLDELDSGEIADWTVSLSSSIRVLNRLNRQLKEMIQ